VIAAAAAIGREALTGVLDVLPTYRTVAVYFDPLEGDVDVIRAAMERAADAPASDVPGALVEVPVVYGGVHGPDLDVVAAFAGVSEEEVVLRHTASEYRVFMLGFLPGFAYLGSVPSSIAAPRRSSPRVRVPAGSVGIAGLQTGVYPFEAPGGWQIIGRTPMPMFDPRRAEPARLAPGDRVRFVRSDAAAVLDADRPADHPEPPQPIGSSRSVTILRPGLLTTIQDEGRWGHQRIGVPVCGAMDLHAHRLANALVGNDAGAATLEATLAGPDVRFDAETTIAVTGADLDATVDGATLAMYAAVSCREGSVLRFGARREGGRAYVAFSGGIDTPPMLGSRATHVRTGMGGAQGQAVRAGDRLPLGHAVGGPSHGQADASPRGAGARLRVLPGPQVDLLPPEALDVLQRTRFTVTPQSDRMGYRLTADRSIPGADREMISDATFPGAIQVPPAGAPILLMADRQTTGGYPQVAVVITADLPLAGQLVPGDWIEFQVCSRADALDALAVQREIVRALG
jgi:KipI family sensor histidine kinase inhibitor